jgi:hypothetical protein
MGDKAFWASLRPDVLRSKAPSVIVCDARKLDIFNTLGEFKFLMGNHLLAYRALIRII